MILSNACLLYLNHLCKSKNKVTRCGCTDIDDRIYIWYCSRDRGPMTERKWDFVGLGNSEYDNLNTRTGPRQRRRSASRSSMDSNPAHSTNPLGFISAKRKLVIHCTICFGHSCSGKKQCEPQNRGCHLISF